MLTLAGKSPSLALLLGAGASCELGMPLVRGITDQLLAYTCTSPEGDAGGIIARGRSIPMRSTFVNLVEGKGMHYEQVIGWLEKADEHVEGTLSNAEVRNLYGHLRVWLIDLVAQQIALAHVQKTDARVVALGLYRRIADWAAEHRPLWIFSLNHDLCVEQIAAQHGVRTSNDFSSGRGTFSNQVGIKDKRLFERMLSYDAILNGSAFFRRGETGINLVRLHGAIHEFYTRHAERTLLVRIEPEVPSVSGWQEVAQDIAQKGVRDESSSPGCIIQRNEDGNQLVLHRTVLSGIHKTHLSDEFLIPPKYPSFVHKGATASTMDMHVQSVAPRPDPAPHALAIFRNQLEGMRRLVAIGYSFGDDHVNEIVASWLSRDSGRSLEIVSPSIDDNNLTRFRSVIDRVSRVTRGAIDYLRMHEGKPSVFGTLEAEAVAYLKSEDEDLREGLEEFRRTRSPGQSEV